MNGRTAKALRRQVYGDNSLKEPRQYLAVSVKRNLSGGTITSHVGSIINHPHSLRAKYRAAKRTAKERP